MAMLLVAVLGAGFTATVQSAVSPPNRVVSFSSLPRGWFDVDTALAEMTAAAANLLHILKFFWARRRVDLQFSRKDVMFSRQLHHLRRHAISYVALFAALSGTSYAAATKLLPKNSVGSRQVINGSLQKVDLSKKAVAALKRPYD